MISSPRPLTPKNRDYLARICAVLSNPSQAEKIAPWLTTTCVECKEVPAPDDLHHVIVETLIGRYVVIGCELYWVINPEALGLKRGRWCDWQD